MGLNKQRLAHDRDEDVDTTLATALAGGYSILNWLLIIYTIISLGFSGVLLAFHLKLIYLNVTTNEFLKDRIDS